MEALSALGGQPESTGAPRWPVAMSLELRGGWGSCSPARGETGQARRNPEGWAESEEPVLEAFGECPRGWGRVREQQPSSG